jgi:RNA-binding protein YlmH
MRETQGMFQSPKMGFVMADFEEIIRLLAVKTGTIKIEGKPDEIAEVNAYLTRLVSTLRVAVMLAEMQPTVVH